MKITKLTTFIVPPRWCFLKVETDEGVVGWGEPVVEGRAHTVAAAVEELSDYLIGKDPRNIEDIWTVLYRGGFYRGGAIHMSALAGIDQALWDIKGLRPESKADLYSALSAERGNESSSYINPTRGYKPCALELWKVRRRW